VSLSRLPLSVFVALRYLRSTRKDAYISFLSLSAAGGICLGVLALILALAALNGFQTALRNETLSRTPHIEVGVPDSEDLPAVRAKVESVDGVVTTQALTRGQVWIVVRGRARAAQMIGFEGELPPEFPGTPGCQKGLYISSRLADSWGLQEGDVVEVASSRPSLTPFGPQPRVRRMALSGIFTSGRSEQLERIAVPLEEARMLTGGGDLRLLVRAAGLKEALEVAPIVANRLPEDCDVQTWKDLNRSLFFALRLEKSLMFVAIFLIVIVAAMALVSDLMLILASKRPEIGMMRAMGVSPKKIREIFLFLGALLVSIGSGFGLMTGIALSWLLDRYRLLTLPDQVYFLDYVPFSVRPSDVAWVVGATWVLALSCTFFAARRATVLEPLEALRR